MKKLILVTCTLAATFCLGVAFKTITTAKTNHNQNMKRVTGIGGIFFKSKDPKKMTEWYQKHLGLDANPYGATFEWYESADSTKKAQTQWTPFPETTKYFEPSKQDFMINYRVENLEALVEELKKEGVTIVDKIESYDYGKFVHILDGEGNKVQLWEAVD
jgi:predicted enzyme related to lactoylglutathione lyase